MRKALRLLAMCLLIMTVCFVPALAAESAQGTIGESTVEWMFDGDSGALYIGGYGEAPMFSSPEDQPWADFREDITQVWFTTMGDIVVPDMAYWFTGCVNMTQTEIPYTAVRVGTHAYAHCNNLNMIMFYYMDTEDFSISNDAFYLSDSIVNTNIYLMTDQLKTLEVIKTYNWTNSHRVAILTDVYTAEIAVTIGELECQHKDIFAKHGGSYQLSNGEWYYYDIHRCRDCGEEEEVPCTCGSNEEEEENCSHPSFYYTYYSIQYCRKICNECSKTWYANRHVTTTTYTFVDGNYHNNKTYCSNCKEYIPESATTGVTETHFDNNGDTVCDGCQYVSIIWDGMGGLFNESTGQITTYAKVGTYATAPSRPSFPGYIFQNYYTETSGGNLYSDTKLTGTITYYTQWIPCPGHKDDDANLECDLCDQDLEKRHVWDKFNEVVVGKYEVVSGAGTAISATKFYVAKDFTVNTNKTFTLVNPIQVSTKMTHFNTESCKTYPYAMVDATTGKYLITFRTTTPKGEVDYHAEDYSWGCVGEDGNYFLPVGNYGDYGDDTESYHKYRITATELKKGDQIGNVSSDLETAYPVDSKSNSYYYTYKGADNIDPINLCYTETTYDHIIVQWEPSTLNKYGGTISYICEYTLDNGTTWNTATTTSNTTATISWATVSQDTSIQIRIKAKDNWGYTSNTWIYGPEYKIITPKYSVTWNANGGSFDGNNSLITSVTQGSIATAPAILPVHEGYAFSGWFTLSSGGTLYTNVPISTDTTFYAHWNVCSHNWQETSYLAPTCLHDGERIKSCSICKKNETETIEATGHSLIETNYFAPNCIADGQQTFDCQNQNCDFSLTKTLNSLGHKTNITYNKTGSKTIHNVVTTCANAGCPTYPTTVTAAHTDSNNDYTCDRCSEYYGVTIDWNTHEGTPTYANTTIYYNETIASPGSPKKTGYIFTGWFTAASGGSAFNASTKHINNTTYHAHWEECNDHIDDNDDALCDKCGERIPGKRYVWGKYSISNTSTLKESGTNVGTVGTTAFSNKKLLLGTGYTVNADKTFTLLNPVEWDTSKAHAPTYKFTSYPYAMGYVYDGDTEEYTLNTSAIITSGAGYYDEENKKSLYWKPQGLQPALMQKVRDKDYPDELIYEWIGAYHSAYTVKTIGADIKGTYITNASSASSTAYPTNAKQGAYWYTYTGADCIDADAVNYGTALIQGTTINISVTPSSGNIYGGTISYQYEYSTDHMSTWTNAGTSTATTYPITIPEGATSFIVRVRASDDWGYTSTSYTYGPEATVTSGTTHKVTWDANNGLINGQATFEAQVEDGSYATSPGTPERTGYSFKGWYTAKTNGTLYSNVVCNSDQVFYAQWTANTYTATFDANGGSGGGNVTQIYNTEIAFPATPTRTGYTFAGWWTDDTDGTQVTGGTWTYTSTQTYYAHWTANSYNANFNPNGGSGGGDVGQVYDQAIQFPTSDPTRTGHTFAGWWSAASGGNQISGGKWTYAANQTFYAHWNIHQSKVTIDPAGGTWNGYNTAQTYTGSYNTTLNVPAPTRTGYTFTGWSKSGTNGTISGTTYTYGAVNDSNVTLTAQWTANTYTATFAGNGGSDMGTKPQTYGVNMSIPGNSSRTGHTFAGWFTAASGGTQVTTSTLYNWATDKTFYAHWTIHSSMLTIDPAGGTWNSYTTAQSYTKNYAQTLSVPNPTRTGYTFAGWSWSGNNGTLNNDTYTFGAANNSNVTLTATWTINTSTLKVNPNGGSWNGSTAEQSFTQDYNTTKNIPNPTRTGYTFAGWSKSGTNGSLNGTTYTFGATKDATDTLTATWTANQYDATFAGNGGADMGKVKQTFNSTISFPADSTRTGYSFAGWYTAAEGGNKVDSTTKYTWPNATTFYAHWTIHKSTLKIDPNGGSWKGSASAQTFEQEYNTTREIEVPTRTGYTFKGWVLNSGHNGSISSAAAQPITYTYGPKNGTTDVLTAQWEINESSLKVDPNGGTWSGSSGTQTFAQAYGSTKTIPVPTRTGYTFKGWTLSSNPNGTISSALAQEIVYTFGSAKGTTDTITAQWAANKYTATFDGNGGSSMGTKEQTFDANMVFPADSSRTGYTFTGWFTAATGGNQVNDSTKYTWPNDKTFYAHWQIHSSTLKVDPNGGTWNGNGAIQTITQNYNTTKAIVVPVRTGYTFKGWTLSTGANGSISSTAAQDITYTFGPKNGTTDTITAQWEINTSTLKVNPNGGTWDGKTVVQEFTQNYNTTKTIPVPTRAGYTFKGWTLSSGANGKISSTAAQQITYTYGPTDNAVDTITAKWTNNNDLTVTVSKNSLTTTYPGTATPAITADSAVEGITGHSFTYQWQVSRNNSTWSNIDGATNASFTTAEAQQAGTYYYRCVVHSLFGVSTDADYAAKHDIQKTSDVITVVIQKATVDTDITLLPTYDPDTNPGGPQTETPIPDGQLPDLGDIFHPIYSWPDDQNTPDEVLKITENNGDPGGDPQVKSSDESIIKVKIEDGKVILTPVGKPDPDDKPIIITITIPETPNYNEKVITFPAYVSDGPEVDITYTPPKASGWTNTDVKVNILINDLIEKIEPTHTVANVLVYPKSHPSNSTTITDYTNGSLPGNLDRLYTYDVKENGEFVVEITDTWGNVVTKDIKVDWIDKIAPTLDIYSLSVNRENNKLEIWACGTDNVTAQADLVYCWNYDENAAVNTKTGNNFEEFTPGTELNIAVWDLAGNVCSKKYSVSWSANSSTESDDDAIESIYKSIDGFIFGSNAYLDAEKTKQAYDVGGYAYTFKVSPKNGRYLGGYMSINNKKFPISWYEDKDMTVKIDTVGDDGVTALTNGPAYGKVMLDPAVFATKTVKRAEAVLTINHYQDTAMEGKITAEEHTHTCGIDVTGPVITINYQSYTKEISVRITDSLTGVKNNQGSYMIGSKTGTCGVYDVLVHPADNSTDRFQVIITAEDLLGNMSTKTSEWFKPATVGGDPGGEGGGGEPGNPGGGGGSGTANADTNVYTFNSRYFKHYLINGNRSNLSIAEAP